MRVVGPYPDQLIPSLRRGIKVNIYIVGNGGNKEKKRPGWGVLAERSSPAPQNLKVKKSSDNSRHIHNGSSKSQKAQAGTYS